MEVLKEIKAARPKLPVLVLSMHPEGVYSTRALRSGASGYLTKESAPEVLNEAIAHILRGGRYITPTAAEMLASELSFDSSKAAHEVLSDREYDVMLRIGSGQSVSHIAETLHLSVKTISTFRGRILAKLKLENNVELAHYARENNLLVALRP